MLEPAAARPRVVLASTSRYRRTLLEQLVAEFEVVAPAVDERSFDGNLPRLGAAGLAAELAEAKARSAREQLLARRPPAAPGFVVLGADQLAVIGSSPHQRLLSKPGSAEAAVRQLLSLAGRAHDLVNGLCLLGPGPDDRRLVSDVHRVRMRSFTRAEAQEYVERCRPFDCVGSYRIEDDADLIAEVEGSGRSGIIGLPLPAVRELLESAGVRCRPG